MKSYIFSGSPFGIPRGSGSVMGYSGTKKKLAILLLYFFLLLLFHSGTACKANKKKLLREKGKLVRCDVIFKKLLRTQTVINVVLYGSHSNIYILNVATSSIRLVLCWTHHKKGNSTLTPP